MTPLLKQLSQNNIPLNNKNIFREGTDKDWPSQVNVFTDGACRGNPGESALGLVVYDSGSEKEIYKESFYLGEQTNNVAEYAAVFRALVLCQKNHVKKVILKSDSQLLVRQLKGEYKVRASGIIPIYQECKKWVKGIDYIEFHHVKRDLNQEADAMANWILDSRNFI